jgi:hypothetical protein
LRGLQLSVDLLVQGFLGLSGKVLLGKRHFFSFVEEGRDKVNVRKFCKEKKEKKILKGHPN